MGERVVAIRTKNIKDAKARTNVQRSTMQPSERCAMRSPYPLAQESQESR